MCIRDRNSPSPPLSLGARRISQKGSKRLRKNHPTSKRATEESKTSAIGLRNSTTDWAGLQKSQCVLEYFAELADLSRAHGSLFARRGEVVVEAFLQVPFKQLDALL